MNCLYCKEKCMMDGQWWDCYRCEVYYTQSDTNGFHIKFERSIKDWEMALNLYPDKDFTVLTGIHHGFGMTVHPDKGHTEIRLNHCMKNVNQHNALDKIKLMLVFQ